MKLLLERLLLIVLTLSIALTSCDSDEIIPNETLDLSQEWKTAKLADVGLDAKKIKEANSAAKDIDRFKSLLIVKQGRLVYEKYYNKSNRDGLNDVRSVTKTIVSSLVGIALKEGFINSLDDPIGEYLDSTKYSIDKSKQAISIKNLLTMTAGFAWEENGGTSYNDWIRAENQLDFVLQQPLADLPGGRFNYNSGAVHLLGVVIEEATGMELENFADQYLFRPIGITERLWEGLQGGFVNGGSGIDLKSRDLARLGQLFLQNGKSGNTQIFPENWILDATSPTLGGSSRYGALNNLNYGYLFWLEEDSANPAYIAWGYGGQFIYVIPNKDMVIITTTNWIEVSQDIGVQALTQSVLDVIVNEIVE